MAIQNINSLNYPGEFTNLNSQAEEYLIQALANLGQRYNIKGDGIGIKTIKFTDLFDNAADLDKNSYIGKISYKTNEGVPVTAIEIVNINSTNVALPDYSIYEKNTNYVITNENIINNPTVIKETSVNSCSNVNIYSDDHYIVLSLVEHTQEDKIIYICEKYDKYTNELISALKILRKTDFDLDNDVIIYVLKNSEDAYYVDYKCYVYSCVLNSQPVLDDNISFTIEDIASKFLKVHGLTGNQNESVYSFTPESILSQIYTGLKNSGSLSSMSSDPIAASQGTSSKICFKYNKQSKMFVLQDSGNEATSGDISTSLTSFDKIFTDFTYDKVYIYETAKEYYSKEKFESDEDSEKLIYKVLASLFSLVYNSNKQQTILYVQLDYEFEYAYNTNNDFQVYFSTHDISVRFATRKINYSENVELLQSLNNKAALICLTTDTERISFYNYSIEYDEGSDNIYGVSVTKHYDLPYINEHGYWVINGVETEIYARGKNAGNPNIVIVESSKGDEQPNIITMADKDYFASIPWVRRNAYIKMPKKYVKNEEHIDIEDAVTEQESQTLGHFYTMQNNRPIQGTTAIKCSFLVPSLALVDPNRKEEHIDKLKYAIILNIAKIDSIEGYVSRAAIGEKLQEIFGVEGRLFSIWALNDDNEFECKTDNEGYAVDFNYMTNMDNLVGWTLNNYVPADPDNFLFTYLAFDNANKQTKNQTSGVDRFYSYPTLSNQSALQYNGKYANELNFKLQFLDSLTSKNYDPQRAKDDGSENEKSLSYSILNLAQSSNKRYLESWFDQPSKSIAEDLYGTFTNSIYEYLPSDTNNSIPVFDLSEVIIKDNTSFNRINILSTNESGDMFYSYFGTRYDNNDKSVVTLGTSTRNINIGTSTLAYNSDSHVTFNEHKELDINFDNTMISSYAYIGNDAIFRRDTISYGINWVRHDHDGVAYWNTTIRPIGSFYENKVFLKTVKSKDNGHLPSLGNNMFFKCYVKQHLTNASLNETDLYYSDALNIPYLFTSYVMPQLASNNTAFRNLIGSITSNKPIITNSLSYYAMILSSKTTNDAGIMHTGNEINITYYMNNGKAYINIDENESMQIIGLPIRLQTDYVEEI